MKCSTCGTENRDSAKFCSLCGTVFDVQQTEPAQISDEEQPAQSADTAQIEVPVAAMQPESEKNESTKFCIKCNAVLRENASFCNRCGSVQTVDQPAATQPLPPVQSMQPMSPYAVQPAAQQPTYNTAPVAVAAVAPVPVMQQAVKIVCGKCGKPMAQTETFCNKCGTSAQYNKAVPVKKQNNRTVAITLSIVGGVLALIVLTIGIIAFSTSAKYDNAISLMYSGEYEQALVLFNELGDYQNSYSYAYECEQNIDYDQAIAYMDRGEYREAAEIFDSLYDFKDSYEQAAVCQNYIDYEDAVYYYNLGYYWDAYSLFDGLGYFKDSAERKEACIQEQPSNGILLYGDSYYSSSAATITLVNQSNYAMHFKVFLSDGTFWCSVFVRNNSRSSIYVPSGTYYFHESIGSLWFGQIDMFGDTGYYGKTIFGDGSANTAIPAGYIFTVTFSSDYNYFVPGGDRFSF